MTTSALTVEPGGVVMQLVGPTRFERAELPVPQPGRGEVVIAMRALGICGTDVHMYHGRGQQYPHVVGHDGAAMVYETGPGVVSLTAGRRVTVDPVTRCGDCAFCRAGQVQLCNQAGYLGMIGPGLCAQYVRLPATQLVPLPDSVSDLAATVLEPVAVALHMLDRVRSLFPNPVPCGVVGAGPLGILLSLVLYERGYTPVLFEPHERRRALANFLGLVVRTAEPVDIGDGARLIVETSAATNGVALAEQLTSPGSVVAVVGRAAESISPASVLLRKLTIMGIKGGPNAYPEAVKLVTEGVLDPADVITHEFGWSEAQQAIATTAAQPGQVVRAALHGSW